MLRFRFYENGFSSALASRQAHDLLSMTITGAQYCDGYPEEIHLLSSTTVYAMLCSKRDIQLEVLSWRYQAT
jgi:hypothetical protein